jgi:hypothetical protein
MDISMKGPGLSQQALFVLLVSDSILIGIRVRDSSVRERKKSLEGNEEWVVGKLGVGYSLLCILFTNVVAQRPLLSKYIYVLYIFGSVGRIIIKMSRIPLGQ